METIVLIIHVVIALAIIGLVLIQQGKGADMGASFGSGSSQTVFGSDGSGNFVTKTTSVLATLFFITSFGLAILAKDKASGVTAEDLMMPEVAAEQELMMPADDTSSMVIDPAADTDMPVVE